MLKRRSLNDNVIDIINYTLLSVVLVIVLIPLVHVVACSLSDQAMVMAGEIFLIPRKINLLSYKAVLDYREIMIGFRNSMIIMAMGTALNLVMTILAAYPLSRRNLWGRNVLMKMITFTMFFSGGLIPTYLMVGKTLGLMNSWLALILPGAISVYNMIIMRTYFTSSIPYEIQEAAEIDGASHFGTLMRIVLPLSGPVVAVIGLYYAVGHWNSYFSALLYISKESLQPLQLHLRKVLILNSSQTMMDMASDEAARQAMRAETIKYAVIVLSSVPMLIMYPFVQRFFIKGVMIGSVKG